MFNLSEIAKISYHYSQQLELSLTDQTNLYSQYVCNTRENVSIVNEGER